MKKTSNARLWIFGMLIMLLLIAILGGIGLRNFYIGYHNADLGYNMAACKDCIDIGHDGTVRSGFELYNMGTEQMRKSVFPLMLAAFAFGFYLMDIFQHVRQDGDAE